MRPLLLEHQASVNVTNSKRLTVLHLAALQGCESTVNILLDHEADPKVIDIYGMRPFECGADYKVRDLLRDFDAKSHLQDLREAIELGDERSVADIIDNSSVDIDVQDSQGKTALHYAAEHGNLIIIKLLLSKEASLDVRSNDRGTVLHVAAAKSDEKVIEALFERGANLHAEDVDERKPLAVVLKNGNWIAARAISNLLLGGKQGNITSN
jgi:ankyrin repeat protein